MNIKAVRGTKDIIGLDSAKYDYVVKTAAEYFDKYGFNRIITPIFEETDLFKRGIGEGTDVVSKEMYTFEDRGGRSCTLRPEGTAAVVRAYLEHKIFATEDVTRWYYHGPMFRYERPQTGRYREFNQIGVEVLGKKDPTLDAEIISMAFEFLGKLGLEDLEVQINSIGGKESRTKYREALINFLTPKKEKLCGDCQNRYENNPLRVLDCKVPTCKDEVVDAPVLTDFLNEEELKHYNTVKEYLDIFGVKYVENPKLVRGLDYYSNTVFEIVTNKLGSQGTVLAGGRYDTLVEQMGGKETPAFGFAMGVERLMLLLGDSAISKDEKLFLVWLGADSKVPAFKLAKDIRNAGISIVLEYEEKSMKAQMKRADKLGSTKVLILGEDEVKEGKVVLKDFATGTQEKHDMTELLNILKK